MHRKWALAVLPVALVVGCGTSSGPGSVAGDEGVIASQQALADPATADVPVDPATVDPPPVTVDPPVTEAPPVESTYDMALDGLATHCTQSRDQLAALVPKVLKDLQDNGINDETPTTVAQHLATAASGVGSGKTDCVGIAAGYAVIRESPSS